ncbi:hypothetical protein QEZ40_007173 [Streptomyces katrae]|uniref:Integral membrane protein n=1 Tax=Streptomyces katrae TaxID=68223 RepID=A0ABT7H7D3_9ACTN|nr:hypothetical protein [Streptomyces katrae]MDK9500970.1 hypothetical protein [Streptomyces katrae]
MIAYAKHLPAGVVPASDVRTWGVEESERFRKARTPVVFAPAAGSWFLAVLVTVSLVLVLRDGGPAAAVGTAWRFYPAAVLLVALPLWYRFLPGAAAAAAALLLAESAAALSRGPGAVLVCLAAAWALAGALLRLRSRRAQERLALAAAGPARFPLPDRLPSGQERRGNTRIIVGALLCLAAAAILVDGLVEDLGTGPGDLPYDAVGQQRVALVLLVLGSTLLGRGWAADLATRRLYEDDQPALVVGVRISPSGHFWLLPGADDTAGRPLLCYRPADRDTVKGARLLAAGTEGLPRGGQHDVDARAEPFEALLHGVPREGAEVVLEYAVHQDYGSGISCHVTGAPLLPRRRHGLGPWSPARVSYRETTRGRREQEEARRREADRAKTAKRAAASGTAGTTAAGGCGGGGGGGSCGGDGCGGGGCGGCGCG